MANESINYPTSPEAVTTQWLSEQLGREVTNLDVKAFGEGAGIIGQVTRATFDNVRQSAGQSEDPNQPLSDSVIIKFPSAAPENRGVAIHYNMYGREADFYRDYAATIPVRVPACWAVEFDAGSHDFVLVLEDLQGFRLGDQVAGASLADAEAAVTAIAQMHAASWNVSLPGLISHNNPAQVEGMVAGFELGWPVVLEKLRHLVPEVAVQKGPKLPANVQQLLDRMTQGPQSLVHADVRLDNLFFATDPKAVDQVALIDWQSVCSCCGEQDLAYFLTQSLPSELLASHGDGLIERYHAQLLESGVSGYSLEECRKRYKASAMYLMCYAVVISGTLDLGNERGAALGAALLGRSLSALDALDAFDLLS